MTCGLVLSTLSGRQDGSAAGGGAPWGEGEGSGDNDSSPGESSSDRSDLDRGGGEGGVGGVGDDGGSMGGGLAFAFGVACLSGALLARATGGVAQARACPRTLPTPSACTSARDHPERSM